MRPSRHALPVRTAPALLLSLLLALAGTLVVTGATAADGASDGVSTRQRQLRYLGCEPGPIDGRAGRMTQAALIRFQAANGLRQSGRLDTTTRQRLSSTKRIACDRRPVPARSGTGRRIVISQTQNWIWLVEPGNRVALQAGVVDNPSKLRPGSYTTGSKCGRPARVRTNTSASGSVNLDHFVRFAPCGIGFHRIPTQRRSPYAQIHPDWWLGTDFDASHGCIRLSARTAKRVWDFTAAGVTRVVVLR